MTEVSISVEDVKDAGPDKIIKIIHISGQLDESNVDEKIKEIYKVVDENPKNLYLIFDLTNLEYMNSKSIGYLTDLYGKLSESGGKVAITNAKSNIIDILQVVGLTQLITTYASVKDAVDEFKKGDTAPAAPAAPAAEAPAEPAQPAAPATEPEAPAEAPKEEAEPKPAAPEAETATAPEPAPEAPETPPVAPTPEPQKAPEPAEAPEAQAKPEAAAAPEAPAEPKPEAAPAEKKEGDTFDIQQ